MFEPLRSIISYAEGTQNLFHFKIALKEISHTKGKLVFWVVVILKIDYLKHVFLELVWEGELAEASQAGGGVGTSNEVRGAMRHPSLDNCVLPFLPLTLG